MDKTSFYKIQTWLAKNGIAEIDRSQAKMQQRKNGKIFTLEEHIKGRIFSLLSAQMVWRKIEQDSIRFYLFSLRGIFSACLFPFPSILFLSPIHHSFSLYRHRT